MEKKVIPDSHSKSKSHSKSSRSASKTREGFSQSLSFQRTNLFPEQAVAAKEDRILTERELDEYVDQRTAWINLSIHIVAGLAYISLPYFLIRYVLGLEMTCYEVKTPGSQTAESYDCGGSTIWTHRFASLTSVLSTILTPFLLSRMARPVEKPGYGIPKFLLVFFVGTALIFAYTYSGFTTTLHLFNVSITPLVYNIFKYPKTYHRPGVTLALLVLIKFFAVSAIFLSLAPYVQMELFLGLRVSALVPFFISATQGATLIFLGRLSAKFRFTLHNVDLVILLTKWEACFFNSLKLLILVDAMNERGQEFTFVVTGLLDILGRNQIWYYFFQRAKSHITGKPWSKTPFKFLRKVFLWSEVDTDHFPMFAFLLMSILGSPIRNVGGAELHTQDRDLNIRENSLLNQTPAEVLILWLFLFMIDGLTYLVHSTLPKKLKFYPLRHHFLGNRNQSVLFSSVIFGTMLTTLFRSAYLLEGS